MDYLQNHCFCSSSNWNSVYYCKHVVSLTSYRDHDIIDWGNITTTEDLYDAEAAELFMEHCPMSAEDARRVFVKKVPTLKAGIITWLALHVAYDHRDNEPGWCIGSTNYRSSDGSGLNIFFKRRKDAMAFIRKFSVYKRPVDYCQYFTDIRKRLNLETMKYERLD